MNHGLKIQVRTPNRYSTYTFTPILSFLSILFLFLFLFSFSPRSYTYTYTYTLFFIILLLTLLFFYSLFAQFDLETLFMSYLRDQPGPPTHTICTTQHIQPTIINSSTKPPDSSTLPILNKINKINPSKITTSSKSSFIKITPTKPSMNLLLPPSKPPEIHFPFATDDNINPSTLETIKPPLPSQITPLPQILSEQISVPTDTNPFEPPTKSMILK